MRYNILKISLLFILLFAVIPLHAFQFAVIQKEKAIVYADQKLTSPIGFFRKGEKVKVGEVLREYGTVLPIAVSGRIGYIATKDLLLANDVDVELNDNTKGSHIASRQVIINEKPINNTIKDNNYISYSFRPFVYQGDWSDLSLKFNDTLNAHGMSHYFSFMHRSPYQHWHFGLDFGLTQLTQESLEFTALFFDINIEFVAIQSSLFDLSLVVTGGLATDSSIADTKHQIGYKGQISNFGYGARFILFPKQRLAFSFSGIRRQLSISNLAVESGAYTSEQATLPLKSITSTEYQIDIMFRF